MENEPTYADIIQRLDQLEEKLEPLLDTWQDVAALGRSGRIIGRAILWSAGVVVGVMAAWSSLNGSVGG